MLSIVLPSLVTYFNSLHLPILLFDVIQDEHLELFFEFDKSSGDHEYLDQMQDLGYESTNALMN